MSQGLSLQAYLTIARMVDRSVPFDVELALLLVQEVRRELQVSAENSDDDATGATQSHDMTAATRVGFAQRGIDAVITEIQRRVDREAKGSDAGGGEW